MFTGSVPLAETGLYALRDGDLTAFAITGNADQKEFADVRATGDVMAPVAAASGGGVYWIEDGLPRFSKASPSGLKSGSGWLALTDNEQFRVLAVRETPLFATLASLAVLLIVLSMMWYREGR